MKKSILTLVAVMGLALAGCATTESAPPKPMTLDYSSLERIKLNVAKVDVVDSSALMQQRDPFIGYMFKPTITDAVYRWAVDRLQPVGQNGMATVNVIEASLMRQYLSTEAGWRGWFKTEQAEKWTGKLEVEINVDIPGIGFKGRAVANAVQHTTLPEDMSEADRQEAYNKVLDGLMSNLNRQLEASIHEHLAPVISTTPAAMTPAP